MGFIMVPSTQEQPPSPSGGSYDPMFVPLKRCSGWFSPSQTYKISGVVFPLGDCPKAVVVSARVLGQSVARRS